MSPVMPSDLDCYLPRPAVEWDLTPAAKPWREVDASLCFVDISGFTALSERLARRGRVGTEQLTEVLNHVFSRMLAIAAEQGGSLLKFGGDALLLLFPGVDHPVCAVNAAIAMRAALRDSQRSGLDAGRLNLKMSVGIHTGTVHLFMVGASHKELLICGPAASQTVKMEQTAEAGEIVVSPTTARALAPGAVGAAKGPGYLVRSRRIVVDGPGPLPMRPVSRDLVASRLPVALRTHLGSAAIESEHRLATVAFVKYTGVDGLLDAEGPEPAAAALDEAVTAVQAAVDAERVTFLASDLDNDGGKIILVTGVPAASDDDEGRMLRAVRRVADAPLRVEVQIGVNRGHVFAGDIGTQFRRTFTIMGDTVNLAARLMAAAPRGAIYSTAGVLDRSHTLFDTQSVPPFHVKGKSEPVQAYMLGAAQGVNPETRSSLPFVGRREELEQLEAAFASAEAGEGLVVLVEAERGLGKSRLVGQLRSRHPETVELLLQGEPYGDGTPYLPFRHSLRALLGISTDDAELAGKQLAALADTLGRQETALVPLLAPIADVELAATPESAAIAPEFHLDRAADLLVKLIDAVVKVPFLIFADDAHWFDETTSELAKRLGAAAATRRWLVVIGRRPAGGGLHLAADETVELRPLEPRAAHELIDAATAAAPLRPHENDVIIERSGGSPLFLEELVRFARTSGTASLPETLDAVANTDIDTLGPRARQVLRQAAVLGRRFDERLLSALLERDGLEFDDEMRRELREYVAPWGGGQMQFRHALLREAAYEGLSYRRRRELHEVAGKIIEADAGSDLEGRADALSLHFFRAQDWEKTWSYARVAAERAKQMFAPGEVALQLERAVEAARLLPALVPAEVAAQWGELGEARLRLGFYSQSEDAFRRAASIVVDDAVEWARHMENRARVVGENERRYASSIRILHRALSRLESEHDQGAEAVAVRLLMREAGIRARQGRLHDCLRLSRAVIERAEPIGELEALAGAYARMDEALLFLGRASEATHLPLALEIHERLGDRRLVGVALSNLGLFAHFEGRWEEAARLFRRGADVAESTGDISSAAMAEMNVGEILGNQGHVAEADAALRHATRTFKGLGYATLELAAVTQLGRVAAELGSDAEARALLEEAITLEHPAGGSLAGIEARGFLAEAHVLAGRAEEALEVVAAARDKGGSELDGTPAGVLLDRVELSARAVMGERAGLTDRIDRALDVARATGTYYERVVLLVLRGVVERESEPIGLADEREALIAQLGIVALPALPEVLLRTTSGS